VKRAIKSLIKKSIQGTTAVLGSSAVGRYISGELTGAAMARTVTVAHGDVRLTFATPNSLNVYRATSFSTKEPETLEWIDEFPRGVVLWDIGGNVGLYSCYAAKHRDCQVFAFEPSVFNLELLARNIHLNGLVNRITIVPMALTDGLQVSTFNMSSTEWGGALSTFGQEYGHDGAPMRPVFTFRTVGLSMVEAMSLLRIPQPDYIKMDVDGIEHLILHGGVPVLQRIRGILVEINDKFEEQAREAAKHLAAAGLRLQSKRHAPVFDTASTDARHTFNQIWTR